MINIAVMGYGTVGSGVVDTNGERIAQRIGDALNVKYVLDIRNFPEDPIQKKVIHDFETIISDDEIQIVVEVMGGIEPAYTFVKRSLLAGKCVVTSNKALVAKHGAELLSIAKEKNINFLFEASVGGGIPIIRPLNSSLTADEIEEITGILNGTTNYMLTKMFYEGADYASVLKEAQDNGYAERNPEADVEGYDACRKIAILSSLISGQQVDFEDIYKDYSRRYEICKGYGNYNQAFGFQQDTCRKTWRDGRTLHALSGSPALQCKWCFQCNFRSWKCLGRCDVLWKRGRKTSNGKCCCIRCCGSG